MKIKTANTLKNLLLTAVVLNMMIIVLQAYNTVSTISFAKRSLIQAGNAALSTFEGGRRAMMALNPEFAPKFRQYLTGMDNGTGILSIYIFDNNRNAVINTGGIQPPHFSGQNGTVTTEDGLFIYRTIKPRNMGFGGMGPGAGRGMGQGMGYGMMRRMMGDSNDQPVKPVICAALVDTAPLTSVKSSEISFLGLVILLQILLGAVFFSTLKMIKAQSDQSRLLTLKEKEAEMGKMSLVMAHELKNPLSTVKGLMEYSAKKSEGKNKEIAESCVDELTRLDRIINDFLNYGRDLTIEMEDTELHSVVSETAKLLEIDASAKHVTISISGGYTRIKADGAKMKQVIFNLLLNAVQAAPENTEISVRLTPDSLSVTNQYTQKPDTEKLGTPFYTTKTVGTGLGLAIVRRITDLHGFRLGLSADETFTAEIKFR